MATAASMQQAEAYLKAREGQGDPVVLARRRALELRAEAGEATLKLSERAADSADAVLLAAATLQKLSETLHMVQSDMRSTRTKLEQILEEATLSLSSTKSGVGSEQDTADVKADIAIPDVPEQNAHEKAHDLFEEWYNLVLSDIASAAASSDDWKVCLSRSAEVLRVSLNKCNEQARGKGWIGRYPSFSTRVMRSYVEQHFLYICLLSSWVNRESAQGQILTEEQWIRLGQGLSTVLQILEGYEYLFLSTVEPSLHLLVATLFECAKAEQIASDDVAAHPMRRALLRVLPCISSNRIVRESIGPLVLVRLTIFLQGCERSSAIDLRAILNDDLSPTGLVLR